MSSWWAKLFRREEAVAVRARGGTAPRIEVTRGFVGEEWPRIGLVTLAGTIPTDGDGYWQAETVTGRVGEVDCDALVFDLSRIEGRCGEGEWCDQFLTHLTYATPPDFRVAVLSPAWAARAAEGRRRVSPSVEAAVEAARAECRRVRTNREKQSRIDVSRVILRGGLGDVRFGMSFEKVRELMGEPWFAGDAADGTFCWRYDGPRLSLEFARIGTGPARLVTLYGETNGDLRFMGIEWTAESEAPIDRALKENGVVVRESTSSRWIGYTIVFSHGLTIKGHKGPPSWVSWTILPDSGKVEEIDWSGKDCLG